MINIIKSLFLVKALNHHYTIYLAKTFQLTFITVNLLQNQFSFIQIYFSVFSTLVFIVQAEISRLSAKTNKLEFLVNHASDTWNIIDLKHRNNIKDSRNTTLLRCPKLDLIYHRLFTSIGVYCMNFSIIFLWNRVFR